MTLSPNARGSIEKNFSHLSAQNFLQVVKDRLFWVYFTLSLLLFLFGLGSVLGAERASASVILLWAFLVFSAVVVALPRLPGETGGKAETGKKAILFSLIMVTSLVWLIFYVYRGAGKIWLFFLLLVTSWGLTFRPYGNGSFFLLLVQIFLLLVAIFALP